eukprot:10343426-Alexandrium_andersonii.AAC.1
MSASLVGSEMCIRDSFGCLYHGEGGRAATPFVSFSALLIAYPSPAIVAVSYTHLTLPTICSV